MATTSSTTDEGLKANDNAPDVQKPRTRQFNCAINPTKQLDKVINDAHLPNFIVEVNNSGYNVNIRCNSGTYAKVVKPSIQTLSANFSGTVDNIICAFTLEPPGIDLQQLDFNDLIRVNLSKMSSPTQIIAKVTMHIHHSSRNVQLQGSTMVEGITAPLWLTKNVLMKYLKLMLL